MSKYHPDHHGVFAKSRHAGESLPRERSECFGYDSDINAALTTGLNVNTEHPPQLPLQIKWDSSGSDPIYCHAILLSSMR